MLLSPPVRKVAPSEQSGSAGWLWEDLVLLRDVGGQRVDVLLCDVGGQSVEEWVCAGLGRCEDRGIVK